MREFSACFGVWNLLVDDRSFEGCLVWKFLLAALGAAARQVVAAEAVAVCLVTWSRGPASGSTLGWRRPFPITNQLNTLPP